MDKSTAVVTQPGHYLVGVERDDLETLVDALAAWTGPREGREPRTPAEREYVIERIKRAARLQLALRQALEGV